MKKMYIIIDIVKILYFKVLMRILIHFKFHLIQKICRIREKSKLLCSQITNKTII